jgi:PRC-barrel domain
VTRGIVPTRKRFENTRHSFSHATHFRPMPARHSLCPVALGEHCPDRRHVGRAQPLRVPARSERRGSSPRRRSMRGPRTAARPSAVPALPPAAPPPDPSSGTPAVVFDDQEVSTILGKSVRSSADEDMGRIVDIIVSRDGQIHAAIIDFGGLLGIGTRKIAVDWRVLNFAPAGKPGAIILQLTRNQVRLAPEYKRGEPVVVVGAGSPERAMLPSEVAAPQK